MKSSITFITSHEVKAEQLSKYLGVPVKHKKIDLFEVQSLSLNEVVEQKAKEAFEQLKTPVLVDDVALTIHEMGKLPGPFIKFFLSEIGSEKICMMMQQFSDRSATATVAVCYCDEDETKVFTGEIQGTIAATPKGANGFGWDSIVIPNGYTKTRGEMDDNDYDATSPRKLALEKLESYLKNLP